MRDRDIFARFFRPAPEYPTRESRIAVQWAMISTVCFGVFILSTVQEAVLFSRGLKDLQERILTASKTLKVDTGGCLGWRATEYCVPYGDRAKQRDKNCDYKVGKLESGWCECTDNIRIDFSCSQTPKEKLSCSERCASTVGMFGVNYTKSEQPTSTLWASPGDVAKFNKGGAGEKQGVKVTFVMLIPHPKQVYTAYETLQKLERNVNSLVQYPYTFFMPGDWPPWCKDALSRIVTTPSTYQPIPPEHWNLEPWVDRERGNGRGKAFAKRKADPPEQLIIQQSNRWWAGYVFRSKVVQAYDYYWRVDMNAFYYCPIVFNPVFQLIDTGKLYGFMATPSEPQFAYPQLGRIIDEYLVKTSQTMKYRGVVAKGSKGKMEFTSCYPSSSSEIVKVSAVNTEEYAHFFEALETTGGFFYERWSDNAIRFALMALTHVPTDFHYFEAIPYADRNGWSTPFDPTFCPEEYMLPDKLAMGKNKLVCLVSLNVLSNKTFMG
eukprot:TRINITY_DN4860_c1_g1_i1.p1 TRINITY_DN4860_c1_g1~~TRINITY_DN4860_c1_g1_i1.p1  ORF type:complete len:493 (+),score=55.04 TRINITY_DN4860_c1_g1_i1:128-1606(+)